MYLGTFALFAVNALDILLTHAAPRVFRPFAIVHAREPRSVALPASVAQAIRVESEGDYRTAPTYRLVPLSLPGPAVVVVEGLEISFSPDGRDVLARPALRSSRGWNAVAFVRLDWEADRVVLAGRFYPVSALSLVAFAIGGGILMGSPLGMIPAALFLVVSLHTSRKVAQRIVDSVAAEVESRVRAWAAGRADARIDESADAHARIAPLGATPDEDEEPSPPRETSRRAG